MTAQAYLNVGTRSQSAGATSQTPSLPGSRTNGNLLIAQAWSKNNATHSISGTGWAAIPGLSQTNSGASMTTSWWYRLVDGTEGAPTISWTGSVACGAQVIQFLRDDESTPPFGFVGTPSTGTTSTHTSTGQNTTYNNSLVIYLDVCAANTAIATPSGWTERFDAGSATGASRNAGGTKSVATSGTGSGNISVTGGAAAWVQVQIELREPVFSGQTYVITNGNDNCWGGNTPTVNPAGAIFQGLGPAPSYWSGFRFPNIIIAQGATITNARLRIVGRASFGSAWGSFYGTNADDAPAWDTSTNSPQNVAKTTASVACKSGADGTILIHDVTAILQEIVNRSGFASGNAVSFAGDPAGADDTTQYYSYALDSTKAAQLLVTVASSGTTVAPSVGHEVYTGYVPTITRTANQTIAPSTGHLLYTGYVPAVRLTTAVAPSTGHLTYTGYAPTINLTTAVAPATGHLVYTGYAPTVTRTDNQSVSPAVGHLVYTGYAPTIVQAVTVAPATGHLLYTGYVPVVAQTNNQSVAPATGHLLYTGYVPTVFRSNNQSVAPIVGHLLYTGYVPTIVQTGGNLVQPATGHLVYQGYTPSVTQSGGGGGDQFRVGGETVQALFQTDKIAFPWDVRMKTNT